MNYTIEGDPKRGYSIDFSGAWGKITECPCCGKPMPTLRKAYLVAESLRLIEGVLLADIVP